MDSEEPPNVRVACSGDIDEVVRLMHDAAAWMSAKGTPAWDVARIDRTFAETFVLRSELLGVAGQDVDDDAAARAKDVQCRGSVGRVKSMACPESDTQGAFGHTVSPQTS